MGETTSKQHKVIRAMAEGKKRAVEAQGSHLVGRGVREGFLDDL